LGLVLWTGCETTPPLAPLPPEVQRPYSSVELREGDVVRITFPGAPSLNTAQQVRRDGKITLDQAGELDVAGKTPAQVEAEILKLYENRLVTKQVVVTVESSAFPVYVSGAVLRPGKIMVTQAISIVEAIMEAGGFDENRAKGNAVVVTRMVNGVPKSYRLDVRAMITGRSATRFYLQPNDVIYVPSRAW
jgi:polysaccharide export outer membrane protein